MTTTELPAGDHARQPRGGNGRFRAARATAERDARVAELLEAGWSFRRVAQELGYRSPASVHEAFGRALAAAGNRGEQVHTVTRVVQSTSRGEVRPRHIRIPVETPEHAGSVVYYLQVGDLVKIGHTSNLQRRMMGYPPGSVLLATEPGGHATELARHAGFADLLAGRREWFHPGPLLMEHITALASRAGVM